MKLTKTEQYLLDNARPFHDEMRCSYSGPREANAAAKLQKRGLARKIPCDGWYDHRCANGDYKRKYWPQGYIVLIRS